MTPVVPFDPSRAAVGNFRASLQDSERRCTLSPATKRRQQQRLKLDVTRKELIDLAAGLQRRKQPIRLYVTRRELFVLQDALDDWAGDAGGRPNWRGRGADEGAAAQASQAQW